MTRILNPLDGAHFFRKRIALDVEEVWAAALASDKRVLAAQCLFRGTADRCLIHMRDVFRFACTHNAASLLLAHNHPSGDVRPSLEDQEWTDQLVKAAQLMMIPLEDHLIIGTKRHFSFRAAGYLEPEREEAEPIRLFARGGSKPVQY